MEKFAPELLCSLEKIFPPGFFVSMAHMILHLPYEARMNGTVAPRWMYSTERRMHDLRLKARNKCKIEASIAEASIIEEVANFVTTYYPADVPTMHNPVSRYNTGNPEHESALSLFRGQLGTSGAASSVELSQEEWASITLYILINLAEV